MNFPPRSPRILQSFTKSPRRFAPGRSRLWPSIKARATPCMLPAAIPASMYQQVAAGSVNVSFSFHWTTTANSSVFSNTTTISATFTSRDDRASVPLRTPESSITMEATEVIFLYLSVPYWITFVLVLYRHDLSRLTHPVRDDGSLRNWWSVLTYLGILDAGTHRPSREKEILPFVVYLSISAGVSLSWILQVIPARLVLPDHRPGGLGHRPHRRDHAVSRTPPRRPYVDVLRYPRLGSRIKHLPKVSSLGAQGQPAAGNTNCR